MFTTYYHGISRKYSAAFGSLFKNISIERRNFDGTRIQTLAVPFTYGPKESWRVRRNQDPNLDKPVSIVLPIISFELTGFSYDSERKVGRIQQTKDRSTGKTQYEGVPYNFEYSLYINVANDDDGTQIIEQILPYFQPDYSLTINTIPELEIKDDIAISLQSVSKEDTYETDFESRRIITYTLTFVVKGYVYGPIKSSKVIYSANVNIYTNISSSTPIQETIMIEPGQYANGVPLNYPIANTSLSISPSSIEPNSEYGIITNIIDRTE